MIANDIIKDEGSVFFDPVYRQIKLPKDKYAAYQGSSYGISMALFIENCKRVVASQARTTRSVWLTPLVQTIMNGTRLRHGYGYAVP